MIGTKILTELDSKYNGRLRILKTWGLGTYIQANGLTQSGGIVESIWKSTLKKMKGNDVKSCLILGFGGGTVAKLVQNNWPQAKIVGVDIDPIMVELGKKYLGFDSQINIKIADANKIIGKYDLIAVDLYNGDKFPVKFSSDKFLGSLNNHLKKEGKVIINRLYYKEKKPEAESFGKKLQKFFSKVEYYYPSANLMFICSK